VPPGSIAIFGVCWTPPSLRHVNNLAERAAWELVDPFRAGWEVCCSDAHLLLLCCCCAQHEFHGDTGKAWAGGCAKVLITSILGDSVEDSVCCSTGAWSVSAAAGLEQAAALWLFLGLGEGAGGGRSCRRGSSSGS
jgi:hypothetical protein